MQGFTIDASTSKDLDDALWVQRHPGGRISVFVSIANVAAHIPKESSYDQRAFDLVETRYFKGEKNHPMLPRRFSEDSLSLLEGQERDVFTLCIEFLPSSWRVLKYEFLIYGKLTNVAKLSHAEIPSILKDSKHPLHEQMKLAEYIARGLMEQRRNNGAFVFYDLNEGWMTTEEGFVHQVKDTEETIGQIIVQEFMILANHQMAQFCAEHEIPVLWRNHTAKAHAPEREELIANLSDCALWSAEALGTLRRQVHMVMNRAEYGAALKGHYGLNLAAYLHCTSPIRRFADLVTQRQIIAHTQRAEDRAHGRPPRDYPYSREELERLANHINTKLQAARDARSKYEVEKVTTRAQGRVASGSVARAEGKDYERIVKVMVRSGDFNEPFIKDYLLRLKRNRLPLLLVYFGLLQTNREDERWQPLRQALLDHLTEHLQDIPSILSIAMTLSGWSEPFYNMERRGCDYELQHQCRLSVRSKDSDPLKGKGTGKSQALAKQRAGLDLLARFLNLQSPKWDDPKPVRSASKIPDSSVEDAVSALNLWCQAEGFSDFPTYVSQRVGGPDHAPLFKTTCRLGNKEVIGEASSGKKTAKQSAAQRMLKALRG